MKHQIVRAAAVLAVTALTGYALATAPTASLARMSGTDVTNASGTLLVVVDNPVNSSGAISRIEISMGSYGTPTTAAVEAGGGAVGSITAGATTTVTLTSPLRTGFSTYVKLSGVVNPSTAGAKSVTVTAYDAAGNAAVLNPKSGKSLSRMISLGSFRSTPYGRVDVNWGNSAAVTGMKVVSTANNNYSYIIYNPVDSECEINAVQIIVPSGYATVATTRICMTNLTTGVPCTRADYVAGTLAAGLPKVFSITNITNSIMPGQIGIVNITVLTHPTTTGTFPWRAVVMNTNTGAVATLIDMPGFTAPQSITTIAAPVAKLYGGIYPWFDLQSGSPGTMGWPTVGSSNNTYRIILYKALAWAVSDNPLKMSNLSFDFSQAAIARTQTNGNGFQRTSVEQYGISNAIAAGAVNNNGMISVTNVINPVSAGSYEFSLTTNGVNVTDTDPQYNRTVVIHESLFTTKPAFGVLVAGSTATNVSGKYYFVVANPINSGDAVDYVRVAIPSGFTISSTSAEITAGILAGNSSMVATATAGTATVDVTFTTPLGEGATAYIPVTLVNPAAEGSYAFSATISGLRDGSALTPSATFPDEANIDASSTVLIGTIAASAIQNVALVGYPNPLRSGNLTVSFSLLNQSLVTVALYDSKNRRVATLANNVQYPSGASAVVWDGKSLAGNEVKNGVYYVKVSASPTGAGTGFSKVFKVVVQK